MCPCIIIIIIITDVNMDVFRTGGASSVTETATQHQGDGGGGVRGRRRAFLRLRGVRSPVAAARRQEVDVQVGDRGRRGVASTARRHRHVEQHAACEQKRVGGRGQYWQQTCITVFVVVPQTRLSA